MSAAAAAPDTAAAHDVQLGRCAGSTDPAEFKAHLEALARACAALAEENEVAKVRRWAGAAAPAVAAAAATEAAPAEHDAEHAAAVEKLVQAARDKAAAVSRLDSKKCEVEETARKLSRATADVRRLEQALGEQQAKNEEDARQLAVAERALAPSEEEEAAAALPAPAAAASTDEGADVPDPAEAERAVWVRCAAAKAIKQQLLRKLPPAQAGGGGGASSLRPLTASERAGVLRATGAQDSFHAQMLCGGCTGALRSYAGQPAQGTTLSPASAAAPLALAGPTPSNPPSTAPPTAPSSVCGDSVSGGTAAAGGPFHQRESSNVYWHKELHGAPARMARPTHPYTLR